MESSNVTPALRILGRSGAQHWNKYCGVVLLFWAMAAWRPAVAQEVQTVRWPELETYLKTPGEQPLLVNFWATWCKPCVQELPLFLRAADTLKGKVEFLFVSMDFEQDKTRKLLPFVQRRGFQSPVWLLNETDYNAFIDKVHPDWSGAIPATLILTPNREVKYFYEKEYHDFTQLWQDIGSVMR